MKISDLFTMDTGTDLVQKNLKPGPYNVIGQGEKNYGIVGNSELIPNRTLYKANTCISIASYGTLFAAVQPKDFYISTRVKCLIPKKNMLLNELLYYAMIINKNKYKFNYGRVGGQRILDINIPSQDEIPEWVYTTEINDYLDIKESKSSEQVVLPPVNEWKSFKYTDLFTIHRGSGVSSSEAHKNLGNTPYVGSSMENNGVTCYTSYAPNEPDNCITVAGNGEGVGSAFYQNKKFMARNADVNVLVPKFKLNSAIGLFLITLMNNKKFKYCYGRTLSLSRINDETIFLPVKEDQTPDWELMESYINSLPYSKYL